MSVKCMYASVSILAVGVCDCICKCMHVCTYTIVLSHFIAFPIPPAQTSTSGPVAGKETDIHRHFREEQLVNS